MLLTPSGRGRLEGLACDAGAFLKGSAFVVASGQSGDFWNLEMGNSVCLLGPPRLWDEGHIRTSPQAVQILKAFERCTQDEPSPAGAAAEQLCVSAVVACSSCSPRLGSSKLWGSLNAWKCGLLKTWVPFRKCKC